MQEHICCTGT